MPRGYVSAHAHRARPAKRGQYTLRTRRNESASRSGGDVDDRDVEIEDPEQGSEQKEEGEETEEETPAPMNDDELEGLASAPAPRVASGAGGRSDDGDPDPEDDRDDEAASACGSDDALPALRPRCPLSRSGAMSDGERSAGDSSSRLPTPPPPPSPQAPAARPRLKLARDSRSTLELTPPPPSQHQQRQSQLQPLQPAPSQLRRPQAMRLQFVHVTVPVAVLVPADEDACSDGAGDVDACVGLHASAGAAACWPVSGSAVKSEGEGLAIENQLDLGAGLSEACGGESGSGAPPGDFGAATCTPGDLGLLGTDPLSMQLSLLLASSSAHAAHDRGLQGPSFDPPPPACAPGAESTAATFAFF
eukprot:tig00020604_g11841.t1